MQYDDPDNKLGFKIPQIFYNRVFQIIAGSILFLALVGGLYAIMSRPESSQDDPARAGRDDLALEGFEDIDRAEVLPQQRREDHNDNEDNDNQAWTMFDPTVDPFSDPMRLTGTVTGGRSGTMAIIESSGTSYIVARHDFVDDLWAVREVRTDSVVLRAHNKEVTLYLDKPPVTRSLDPADEEDREEDE